MPEPTPDQNLTAALGNVFLFKVSDFSRALAALHEQVDSKQVAALKGAADLRIKDRTAPPRGKRCPKERPVIG